MLPLPGWWLTSSIKFLFLQFVPGSCHRTIPHHNGFSEDLNCAVASGPTGAETKSGEIHFAHHVSMNCAMLVTETMRRDS
jgi:hypothetical protein